MGIHLKTQPHMRRIVTGSVLLLILSLIALIVGTQGVWAHLPGSLTTDHPLSGAFSQGAEPSEGRAGAAETAEGDDWPQVQRDPQRTGYSPEVLGTNFRISWQHAFQPEKIYPQVQAIVYGGRVYVGTEMGRLYALDAMSGAQAWVYQAGGSLLNSVGAADGLVYFGCMDGAVYALNATSGSLVWKTQLSKRLGFSTAPVIADHKVLLGGRDGMFYALDAASGVRLWEYEVGAPILQTAAWDNGRVFFGAMDMYVYALSTTTGKLAWRSARIPQMAFKDYWPVVTQGKVIVRPMGSGALSSDGLSDSAQNAALADYDAHPGDTRKSLYVLSEASGVELPAVIHWDYQTMNGATTPPCVDRDGYLIGPVPRPDGSYGSGWGRLNLSTRKVVDVLSDGTSAGFGNWDENLNLSCTANLVLSMHTEEGNANYTGAFDLNEKRWTQIDPGQSNRQMSSNTQGGGGNPASVAYGMLYHISWHELIARTTE